eukprot:TRINITY_DN585_c0_g1_i1.p1 TRINITY_DN585_c0_g1~~TRINITY_DN585_c0_g1_i1.p1  ORF type:complete len:497 (+),score=314.87 TRINITY_DN585_c0_g1_i1:117-1493(+)
MNMIATLLMLALLALAGVRAEEEIDESDVVVLGTDNFDTVVADNEFVLVEFYAPWCGHCKRLKPEYAKAATELKESGVVLGMVDATVESDLAGKFEVRGYPTLKFFRGGKPADYNGGRTAPEIVAWCAKKSGPPSTELEADAVAAFVEGKAAVVGTFASRDSAAYKAFIDVAKDGDLDDFVFADVAGDADSVTLYTAHAEPQVAEGDDLKAFVLANGYPLVDELPAAWERYSKKGLPLAILFIDPAADNAALLAEATAAAAASEGKLSFSFADGVRFAQQIDRMGGRSGEVPQIAAMKLDGKANYPYDGELTSAALTAWAAGIADGSIQPHLKSEPVPEDNDGPVTVLVGKNIDEYLTQTEKDVLIEIYAPWCGHCKAMASTWVSLAANNKNAKVRIAEIDCTTDGAACKAKGVRGYPTIILYGNGIEDVKYSGARTEEAFTSFLGENVAAAAGKEEL